MDKLLEDFYERYPDALRIGDYVMFEGNEKPFFKKNRLIKWRCYTVKKVYPENIFTKTTTTIELMEIPGFFPDSEFRKIDAVNKIECDKAVQKTFAQITIAPFNVGDYVRVKSSFSGLTNELAKIVKIENGAALISYGVRQLSDLYRRYETKFIPFDELDAVEDE